MATGKKKSFRRDDNGGAFMEFTIVAGVMMVLLFGILEFTRLFYQWNAATKALQIGARLASTSAPIWQELNTISGAELAAATSLPGEQLDYDYKVVCQGTANGTAGTCSVARGGVPGGGGNGGNGNGNGNNGGNTGSGYTFSTTAMDTLLYGRDASKPTPVKLCGDRTSSYPGMCDIFDRIGFENVRISYEHTGMGYIARPGGLVPTITLEIVGLNFEFIFIDDVIRIFNRALPEQIAIPGLKTTISAEDMRPGAPSF